MTSVEVPASLAVRLVRPVKVPMVMQTKETVAYRFGGPRLAQGVFRRTPLLGVLTPALSLCGLVFTGLVVVKSMEPSPLLLVLATLLAWGGPAHVLLLLNVQLVGELLRCFQVWFSIGNVLVMLATLGVAIGDIRAVACLVWAPPLGLACFLDKGCKRNATENARPVDLGR